MVFLSLQKTSNTYIHRHKPKPKYTSKRSINKNAQTEQNEKKKVYKSTNEFVLSWPTSPGHEAYSEVNIPRETPLEETHFFFATSINYR